MSEEVGNTGNGQQEARPVAKPLSWTPTKKMSPLPRKPASSSAANSSTDRPSAATVDHVPMGEKVMSEYERQRRAYRGDLRRQRASRLLTRLLLLLVAVVVAYAVVGYYAMSMLPEQIAELERRHQAQTEKADDSSKEQSELRASLEAVGYKVGGEDTPAQREALMKALANPKVAQLIRKHLGDSAVRDCQGIMDINRRLAQLKKEEAQLKNRESMLSKEFNGPVGKGSKSWQLKMSKVRTALEALTEKLTALETEAAEKFPAVYSRINGLCSAMSEGAVQQAEEEARLDGLRERREMLMVWPLPQIEKALSKGSK